MKKPLLILLTAAALLAAGAAWHHQSRQSDGSHTSYKAYEAAASAHEKASASLTLSPASPKPDPTPPDRILTDAPAIFKKAFWRDPSPEDHIAHAERREWREGEGVTRWEWYLEVNASPGLLKYLREENAFGLLPATPRASANSTAANVPVIAKAQPPAAALTLPENRPAWFQFNPADTDVFQSRAGKLRLYFSKSDNKLYASNAGQGFQRGASAPATTAAEMPAASAAATAAPAPLPGRLPTTPPPIPSP